ncbi:hypothetical protein [Altibacter sp. HG106]|uniref:hypothetical protein n=1 Tax=Altibacter sp. HG106 TaxID=3023937 RepID=UPI002350DBD8|nr:hypothetical protein [Altibacter sp. HG106]MDC7994715.1 hypothetical protein [Altibacter sp. HG106]
MKLVQLSLRVALCLSLALIGLLLLNVLWYALAYSMNTEQISEVTYSHGYFETNIGTHGFSLYGVMGLLLIAIGAVGCYYFLYLRKRSARVR